MLYQKARALVMTCGVAAMLFAAPAESNACCGWLFGGWGAQTTYSLPYMARTYAPVYSASACTSCVPQTVSYMPQTSYRTVYRAVPVTSYWSGTSCDPCTGCPVTYYRPVTTWTYRATLMPYTTYRAVYSNPCDSCVSYAPCSTCGPGVASPLAVPGSCCPSTGPAPSSGPTPKTFQEQESAKPSGESANEGLEPSPDPSTSSTPVPDLIEPATRTTSRPVPRTVEYRPVALQPEPAAAPRARVNDGGWRAARD